MEPSVYPTAPPPNPIPRIPATRPGLRLLLGRRLLGLERLRLGLERGLLGSPTSRLHLHRPALRLGGRPAGLLPQLLAGAKRLPRIRIRGQPGADDLARAPRRTNRAPGAPSPRTARRGGPHPGRLRVVGGLNPPARDTSSPPVACASRPPVVGTSSRAAGARTAPRRPAAPTCTATRRPPQRLPDSRCAPVRPPPARPRRPPPTAATRPPDSRCAPARPRRPRLRRQPAARPRWHAAGPRWNPAG